MLRELLYVDVARCRSLLSQLDRGIVEQVVQSRSESSATDFGATLLGLKGERASELANSVEESRSLQDLVFTVFEEIVDNQGILRTVDQADLSDPEKWNTSKIHRELIEGEIIRIFTPVAIVDPQFLGARFDRFAGLMEALNELGAESLKEQIDKLESEGKAQLDAQLEAATAEGLGRDQVRKLRNQLEGQMRRAVRDAKERSSQGPSIGGQVSAIVKVLGNFLSGDSMSVRFLACGADHPDLAFVGSLLGRDEYIQRERDALFSRYGSTLMGWTSVVQVVSVPSEAELTAARSQNFSDITFVRGDNIDRAATEQGAMRLLGYMDALGISEGPVWPGISVTPLGIYRTVPRSDGAP